MNTTQVQNKNEVDAETVRELELFAENTESLYTQKHMPIVRNYRRKIEKGVFDEQLALKGIVNNYVSLVVSQYRKQFGLGTVNKATKDAFAKSLLASVMQDIKEGVQ